jgi:hypothetical protein
MAATHTSGAVPTPPASAPATSPAASTKLVPAFETITSAARKLGVDTMSLRRRCLRDGERVGDCIVALLGDGVVAFKFGGRWRIRFSRDWAAHPAGSETAGE